MLSINSNFSKFVVRTWLHMDFTLRFLRAHILLPRGISVDTMVSVARVLWYEKRREGLVCILLR